MIAQSIEDIISGLTGKKRIILVGEASSGKDYARNILESRGFPYQISYTTRPMRTGEIHGKDYYFIPEFKFKELINMSFFYEYVVFNTWYYGTSNTQMKSSNCVFIMTPSGLSSMDPSDREESLVVYFNIPEDIRKERLALRSDADTVDRRLAADAIDFAGFMNYDMLVTNPKFI